MNLYMFMLIQHGDKIFKNSIRSILLELLPDSDHWKKLVPHKIQLLRTIDVMLQYTNLESNKDIEDLREISNYRNKTLYQSLIWFLVGINIGAIFFSVMAAYFIGIDEVSTSIVLAFVVGVISLAIQLIYVYRIQERYIYIDTLELHGDPNVVKNKKLESVTYKINV